MLDGGRSQTLDRCVRVSEAGEQREPEATVMKFPKADSAPPSDPLNPRRNTLGQLRAILSTVLTSLNSIDAETAIRVRLQILVDEIAGPGA